MRAKGNVSRVALRQSRDQIRQKEILRLFRSRVGRLADPVTAFDALKEVLEEVRQATGERERANRQFFEALNFHDGLFRASTGVGAPRGGCDRKDSKT